MAAGSPVRDIPARLGNWLFQGDRPAVERFVLGQRQIFILPSRNGLLYGLVLTVMYIGAVNYSLGLGHALVFLLAALGLTGMVHSFRNLAGLRLEAVRGDPVHVGETARFRVKIENDRAESRPALNFVFRGEDPVRIDVEAGGAQVAAIPCRASRRGWLVPPRLTLFTQFPLGLFHAWSYPRLSFRLLVYPQAIDRPFPDLHPGDRPGTHGNDNGDDDFAGFRTRQPGDPLHHVAWKNYARDPLDRPLQIKCFSGASTPDRVFDWVELGVMGAETRISILTGWVLRAAAADLGFTLRLPDRQIGPGSDPAHLHQCLKALALHGQAED
jgi:uncharacterized protein (DUF58 family)